VSGESVPDEDALLSKLSPQILEEGDQTVLVVAVRLGLKEEPTSLAIPAKPQRCRHRHLLPVERVNQDGCLAFGRPCAADGGPL